MSDASIRHLSAADFDAAVSETATPLLVDFWAAWCGPCKMIAPILDELARELAGQVSIAKVDVDAPSNGELAARFGIRAIPTLLLFKGGELVEKIEGLRGKADLRQKLQAAL